MRETFRCETVEELTVDIDDLVQEYKEYLADGSTLSIEDYVSSYWDGLDDCYYYCDNSDEIQAEICELMREAMADGNK